MGAEILVAFERRESIIRPQIKHPNGIVSNCCAETDEDMRRTLAFVIGFSMLLWMVGAAQSNTAPGTKTKTGEKVTKKSKRVWDNEELQALDGGISVVGDSREGPSEAMNPEATPTAVRRPQNPAPTFSGVTMDGMSFSNDSLRGRPVLIQFWATWCPRCREDQEPVDEIARKFANKGLTVLAVDSNENAKTVASYLKKAPRSCPVVLEQNTNLTSVFSHSGLPTYVVIDADGNVAIQRKGAHGESGLRALLAKAGVTAD